MVECQLREILNYQGVNWLAEYFYLIVMKLLIVGISTQQ